MQTSPDLIIVNDSLALQSVDKIFETSGDIGNAVSIAFKQLSIKNFDRSSNSVDP